MMDIPWLPFTIVGLVIVSMFAARSGHAERRTTQSRLHRLTRHLARLQIGGD
jgi:hypothetical protein